MLLNIGCGAVAHPAWLNLDIAPQNPLALACDLRRGLPLADGSCDATYSSHVLEHLSASESLPFLAEQHRVLKPGGVLRVVVPDLESICNHYLQHLKALRQGQADAEFRYRFALLELFDQGVRDFSGGDLLQAYKSANPVDVAYILQRHGDEARQHVPGGTTRTLPVAGTNPRARASLAHRLAKKLSQLRAAATRVAVHVVGGQAAAKALRVGQFRLSGEVHRTMYDSYSLSKLLQDHEFVDVRAMSAFNSRIPGFIGFELDSLGQQVRKPDSLFVEALKPSA